MAKRRAEVPLLLLHDSPSKTLLSVGLQLEAGPPAARPVLGSHCRKRPHSSQEPEQKPEDPGVCTTKHAADVTVQTSGRPQEHHSCGSTVNLKKRPREDCETSSPAALDKVAERGSDTEDCAFNSFQFWRLPLPKLDLSLLEDYDSQPQTEQRSKVKDRSSDLMET